MIFSFFYDFVLFLLTIYIYNVILCKKISSSIRLIHELFYCLNRFIEKFLEGIMSKKLLFILSIVTVIISFTGISIVWSNRSDAKLSDNTTVVVDGNTHRTLKAEIGNLYPGKTAEYVINLAGDNAREYDVTLNFQGDDDGVLKDYVTVAIITENTIIEKPLGELLKGDTVALGGNTSVITLSYTMSESASNETQESDISFYIDLNAKRS